MLVLVDLIIVGAYLRSFHLTQEINFDTLRVTSERALVQEVTKGQHHLQQPLENRRLANTRHRCVELHNAWKESGRAAARAALVSQISHG